MTKPSILIVDDEAIIVFSLQIALERLGYAVAGMAYHGAEALELLKQVKPDLILMDIFMRGETDGIETANFIRDRYDIPLIFLTAAADNDTVQRAKQSSPFGYLLKPVRDEELGIAIEYAIERHRLEQALSRSEARFRELFETSLDGITITNLQGEILECNPAFAQLLGYDRSALTGRNIDEFTLLAYGADKQTIIRQALARGYSDEFLIEYVQRSGQPVPISLRIWTRTDDKNQPVGFWASIRDLTALQKSEKARVASEVRLQSLLDQTPNGVAVVDADGQVLTWNPSMERFTGVLAAEALNQPIWNALYRATPPGLQISDPWLALQAQIHAMTESSQAPGPGTRSQVQIQKNDGTRLVLEQATFPIHTTDHALLGVVLSDITQQKANEEQIRRSNEFANLLAQAAGRLNAQLDVHRVFEIIGQELGDGLAASSVTLYLYHPESETLKASYCYRARSPELEAFPLWHHQKLISTAQTVKVIEDVQQVALPPHIEIAEAQNLRTLVVINLLHEDRLIGAIHLAYTEFIRRFEEAEIVFLTTYAHHAAIAIDRALIYQDANRRAAALELLNRLSIKLRLAATRQAMLPILLEEAVMLTEAATGVIYLLDASGGPGPSFCLPDGAAALGEWFTPGEPLWTRALSEEGELIHFANLAPLASAEIVGVGCERLCTKLAIVLRTSQAPVGLIALGITHPFTLTGEIRQVCWSLSEIGGNALQRSGLTEVLEQHVIDRTRELAALYDLTLFTNTPLDLEEMLAGSLNRVLRAVGAQAAILYQYRPDTSSLELMAETDFPNHLLAEAQQLALTEETRVWLEANAAPWLAFRGRATPQPALQLKSHDRWGTIIYAPVHYEQRPVALMCIAWEAEADIATEDIALLGAAAERLGSAIQNRALRQQAEQAAVLEERQRLARTLHDSVTQLIFGLTLLSEAGLDLAAHGDTIGVTGCLKELQQSSLQALREMRLMLFELRPAPLEGSNLEAALQHRLNAVERRAGVLVELCLEGTLSLPESSQAELYHVASEALNNCLKHSRADKITLRLISSPDAFKMVISDNGRGFETAKPNQAGMGLGNMHERVRQLGGELIVQSQPGAGCSIQVSLGQST
jgi:PAS domain S-box-containing protein